MSLHKKLTERNYCSQIEKQNSVLFESKTYSMTGVVLKCFLVNQKRDDQFVNQATHMLYGFYLPKRTNSIKLFVCESGYTNDWLTQLWAGPFWPT